MEDKRIGYLKTLFTDLANTYHRLLPEMSKVSCQATPHAPFPHAHQLPLPPVVPSPHLLCAQTFGECVQYADNIKGPDTIAAICKERGTGPFLAVKRLYTCWV